MKKSYLMIAAAAALFAACASNDTFKDVDTQESAITFDQILNNTTRAAIGGGSTTEALAAAKKRLAEEGGFIVYGYKRPSTAENWNSYQTVFENVNVKCIDGDFTDNDANTNNYGSTWGYDNLRFWDKNSKYNFYAIAPYNPAHGTYSLVANSAPGALLFKITGAQYGKSDNADTEDFLIDRDGATDISGSYTGTHNKVGFDFHHIMTKVDFKLKSTLSNGIIEVTSLTMTGWNSNTGTFTQSSSYSASTSNHSEWAITAQSPAQGNVTLVPNTVQTSNIIITCGGATVDVNDWYIMIPQEITTGLTFTLTYTYKEIDDKGTEDTGDDETTYQETYTDQVATISTAQIWGTDTHVTYTLDIKPSAIDFDVTSICGFHLDNTNNVIDVQ